MLSKVAAYYWEGPPMSWLRQQSIASFRHLNPDWEVRGLVRPQALDGEDTMRARAIRSDLARYRWLAEDGGLYFDTDIIWRRPIPEAWRDSDVLIPMRAEGIVHSIAVLGGTPGRFWKHVADVAGMTAEGTEPLAYQSLGVKLLNGVIGYSAPVPSVVGMLGERFLSYPHHQILPVSWAYAERLWSAKKLLFDDDVVGVHWYGGDPLSIDMEPRMRGTSDDPSCVIRDLISEVFPSGEPAAVRASLGL